MNAEVCGNLVNVVSGEIEKDKKIIIENGKITNIVPSKNNQDVYLFPGIIDTHVHIVLEPYPQYPRFSNDETDIIRIKRMLHNVTDSLKSGITTIRDCGHPDNSIYQLRNDINNSPELGSRIICCGRAITNKNGHAKAIGVEVTGVKQMEEVVKEIIGEGADFIKIINNDPGSFSLEELKTAVDTAHKYGKKVSCHLYQANTLRKVLDSSADFIEHFLDTDRETILEIKNKGIIVSPTYIGALDAIEHPEGNQIGDENLDETIDKRGFENWVKELKIGIQKLIKNKVTIATGTDAGFLYCNLKSVLREIVELNKLDMTPLGALQAATINASQVIGKEKDLGSINIGKLGDIIVYKDNPLENIHTIFSPLAVYKEGIKINI